MPHPNLQHHRPVTRGIPLTTRHGRAGVHVQITAVAVHKPAAAAVTVVTARQWPAATVRAIPARAHRRVPIIAAVVIHGLPAAGAVARPRAVRGHKPVRCSAAVVTVKTLLIVSARAQGPSLPPARTVVVRIPMVIPAGVAGAHARAHAAAPVRKPAAANASAAMARL